MSKQLKSFKLKNIEVKAEDDARTIEGYASVFDNVDSYGDIVRRGAFTKTLNDKRERGVKFLYQHRSDCPIGVPTEIREDGRGLYVKAQFANTQLANETYELAKMGALDGLSIGYRTIKDVWSEEENTRELLEVALYEFSIVTFEANTQAKITAVKSDDLHTRITSALLQLGHSKEQAAHVIKSLSLDDFEPRKHSQHQADNSKDLSRLLHSLKNVNSNLSKV